MGDGVFCVLGAIMGAGFASGREIMVLFKPADIIVNSRPYFYDILVGKDSPQWLRDASHQLDPEQERLFGSGQLQQRDSIMWLVG